MFFEKIQFAQDSAISKMKQEESKGRRLKSNVEKEKLQAKFMEFMMVMMIKVTMIKIKP